MTLSKEGKAKLIGLLDSREGKLADMAEVVDILMPKIDELVASCKGTSHEKLAEVIEITAVLAVGLYIHLLVDGIRKGDIDVQHSN